MTATRTATRLRQAADEATKAKDWHEAAILWRRYLAEAGQSAPEAAHLRLAQALRRIGDLDTAEAVLQTRLQMEPHALQPRLELARLSSERSDWATAASRYQELLDDLDTPPAAVFAGLASSLAQLCQFDLADEVRVSALARGVSAQELPTIFPARCLGEQFAALYGLDPELVDGKPFDGWRTDGYKVGVGADHLRSDPARVFGIGAVTAVEAGAQGGWGNRMMQLATAVQAAEALETPRVYVGDSWFLDRARFHAGGIEVLHGRPPSSREHFVLSGRFLYRRTLQRLLLTTGRSAWKYLTSLRTATCFQPMTTAGDEDLVIHVRAGSDVFGPRRVNPRYGQPPLSYYRRVLDHRDWRTVYVVFEDFQNPVIRPLLAAIRDSGREAMIVQDDLTETINFLLGARNLAAGRGTFIPVVAGLSTRLRHLYNFEGALIPHFESWHQVPGVIEHRVIDAKGQYRAEILVDGWENSPSQRDLMVSYPIEALRMASLTVTYTVT